MPFFNRLTGISLQLTIYYILLFAPTALPMKIEWLNMTGQWPAERGPVVVDLKKDGEQEIVILNRGGQLLHWTLDGEKIGVGQDGMEIQLPEGTWPSRPTVVDHPGTVRLIACSVEGLVVAVDEKFKIAWRYQLPGKTTWGYANPAVIEHDSQMAFVFSDQSGMVTCLNSNGEKSWEFSTSGGKSTAPPQTIHTAKNGQAVLLPIGSMLFYIDQNGKEIWKKDLGETISTRPTLLVTKSTSKIICGSKQGSVFGLDLNGSLLWKNIINDEVHAFFSLLPVKESSPLILCTGLWGNLFAIDENGENVWTHYYRAKGRGEPLVYDADGDGDKEILISTYAQHLYAFDETGNVVDDVRLNGTITSSPILLFDPLKNRHDILLTTNALSAFRLSPSIPVSPYGVTNEPKDISFKFASRDGKAVIVQNPNGGLINVNCRLKGKEGDEKLTGCLTARSRFEIPLSKIAETGVETLVVSAQDRNGNHLEEQKWVVKSETRAGLNKTVANTLKAWATPAFGDFSTTRISPFFDENEELKIVSVGPMYGGEIEQGAFIIASNKREPVRVRIILKKPERQDGASFSGTIALHKVVHTNNVDGGQTADALPKLNDAGIITIPAQRSLKIWQKVDARSAAPGVYNGNIHIIPLQEPSDTLKIALTINILDLKMPEKFPLDLCTWDYLPNNWFPERTGDILDDMACHGVTIFPRGVFVPKAEIVDKGQLNIDWAKLDAALEQYKERGKILFQISHPPITFATEPTKEQKYQAEIQYIRAFIEQAKIKGWEKNDYAFYPTDEPGLHYGERVPHLMNVAKLFREADPELRVYTDPVQGLSWQDFESIESLIDVWCPNMHLVSGLLSGDPRMKRIMKSTEPIWSYECVSQVKSLSPLRYNRANAWRAKYFGLDGIGFWTYSTTNIDHWFGGKTINDEYAMVYPGDMPVSSVRWEAVRDGMEDVTAISMLEDLIANLRMDGTQYQLVKDAEDAIRMALVDMMELSDLAFVQSRDYLCKGDRQIWHTLSDIEMIRKHRETIAQLTTALSKTEDD